MIVEYEPIYDGHRFVLIDIFIDGVWHGSRRTFAQCLEYVSQL
jgi:hypothetical protein